MISTSRKKLYIFGSLAILIGAFVVAVLAYSEIWVKNSKIVPNLGLSADEIGANYSYFYLYMPQNENPDLPCDYNSYCFGDDNLWFFLPENIDTRTSVIYAIDEAGNVLGRFEDSLEGNLTFGSYTVRKQVANLPVMYITLEDHWLYDQMLETLDKSIVCYGDMKLYVDPQKAKENGWYSEYLSREGDFSQSSTMSIRGRGNHSWSDGDKKSFTMELEKSEDLLGMGSSKKWNLIGSCFDKTLLKNVTFNEIAANVGIEYEPKMEAIDLYIDGEYRGVYYITTKLTVSKETIDLKKGDYLYCLDRPEPDVAIPYESKFWFDDGNGSPTADIVYPSKPSSSEIEEGQEILQRFIDALETADSDEFLKYTDLDSMVAYYWVEELSMNFDGWGRSLYIWYDHTDGKMHFGPIWDMDTALGSPYDKAGMWFSEPEGWRMRNAGIYEAMFIHPEFVEAANEAYLNGGISEAFRDGIDIFYKYKEALGYDAELNYLMFGQEFGTVTLRYDGADHYDTFCDSMIDFYRQRLEWMDEELQKGA